MPRFCWLVSSDPIPDFADYATILKSICSRKLVFFIYSILLIILEAVALVRSFSSPFPYLSMNLRKYMSSSISIIAFALYSKWPASKRSMTSSQLERYLSSSS